jgi:hypothetical protein
MLEPAFCQYDDSTTVPVSELLQLDQRDHTDTKTQA